MELALHGIERIECATADAAHGGQRRGDLRDLQGRKLRRVGTEQQPREDLILRLLGRAAQA